jgi:transcriptional regulator with XRE-family HTH domain
MSTQIHLLIANSRTSAGISQAELARRAGIPRSVMNVYEHGKREPSAAMLARVLNAAGFRLAAVPLAQPTDPVRAGAILEDVLDLAEALPYSPKPSISSPPLASVIGVAT